MFKDKLKELRETAGYSQRVLAEKIFVSRSAVAKWENGNGIPSDVNIEAICNLFNITKQELFGENIIDEYREVTNNKTYYNKVLKISVLILCSILLIIVGILIIEKVKYNREYEQFKETMTEQANFNKPVESFGDIEEPYLTVIKEKLLFDDKNVFLDNNYIYVVNYIDNGDFAEITRYDYNFNIKGKFEYFLNSGHNEVINQIKTTKDDGIMIACNRSTYYEEYFSYNGYSQITIYNSEYNIDWEYVFKNGENDIEDIYEYNNRYYIFSTYSEFSNNNVQTNTSIKIYMFSNHGNLLKEENVTTNDWGSIHYVLFENKKFYIYGDHQPVDYNEYKIWEYDDNLNLISSKGNEDFIWLDVFKSSYGNIFYEDEELIINNRSIQPTIYGKIKLKIDFKSGSLLVFDNIIGYDWQLFGEFPYVSFIPLIIQKVYLFIDYDGNILWCKSV